MKIPSLTTFALLLPLFFSSAHADVVKIPLGQQGESSIALPDRGLSSSEVEAKFGAPQSKTAAKGKPPIKQWHYTNFSVYFESDYVIHSVRKNNKH